MRPRLFAEIPAGLASVSLRLHGGPKCRPPISRMGNKAGYAEVILGALGLDSGSGAGAYLFVEADPDVRALLCAYPDGAMLQRIAAIIRGWADEEPRALWERLRAERKERGPREDAEGTASGLVEHIWTIPQAQARGAGPSDFNGGNVQGAGGLSDACDRLAAHTAGTALLHRWSFSEKGPDHGYGGPGCEVRTDRAEWTTADRDKALGCGVTAERFEAMAREVAGWAAEAVRTMPQAQARGATDGDFLPRVAPSGVVRYAPSAPSAPSAPMAALATGVGWPPVIVAPRVPRAADVADLLGTPGDLDGVVIYCDPPYAGTTGYRDNLTRAEVVAYAADFAALGAVVCVSEAVAIPELVAMGWHAAEVTEGRRGQKRTFSAQKREWITMNREPAHRVAVQPVMLSGVEVAAPEKPARAAKVAPKPAHPDTVEQVPMFGRAS